ncbi:MAG TPA: VanZ family protein [Burkholderiales bacterium]
MWLAVGWAMVAAIVWLSLTPSPPKVDFEQSDKVGHFLAYGGVMFWFAQLYVERKARLGYAAGFVAMGVSLEFIQGWTGYRDFELYDMLADGVGVALGWAAALLLPGFLPKA